MKYRLFVFFLIIIPGLLFAEGTREKDTEAGVTPVSLTIASFKGPSGFGMIKMFEDKLSLGRDVSSEYIVLPGPKEMAARVATGEVDIAVFPVNMAAKLYTEGPGYKLGAITGNGLFAVLSNDAGINSWEDLKGKHVYSAGAGATPEYLLKYFMTENGLDPDDFDIDFSVSNAAQLAQLAIGGKADTVILPQPFTTLVEMKSDLKVVIDFQEEWRKLGKSEEYPVTVVVISPDLVEKRPDAVSAFLTAYSDSIDWVNSNPQEAAALIEKYDIMPAAVAGASITSCNLAFTPSGDARQPIEDFLNVLLKYNPGSIGGTLPDEDFYLEK